MGDFGSGFVSFGAAAKPGRDSGNLKDSWRSAWGSGASAGSS
jgi:hypothetical protein